MVKSWQRPRSLVKQYVDKWIMHILWATHVQFQAESADYVSHYMYIFHPREKISISLDTPPPLLLCECALIILESYCVMWYQRISPNQWSRGGCYHSPLCCWWGFQQHLQLSFGEANHHEHGHWCRLEGLALLKFWYWIPGTHWDRRSVEKGCIVSDNVVGSYISKFKSLRGNNIRFIKQQ